MQTNTTPRITRDPSVPATVLVVDDDELMRAHLAAILQFAGYYVQTAPCAREALQILERTHGCVVLADWEMPDMDGLTLCRTIRQLQRESYVYVLLLTIRDEEDDLIAGFNAGADDYLVKGIPVEELIARLECGRRIVAHHGHAWTTTRTETAGLAGLPSANSATIDFSRRLVQDYGHCRENGAPMSALVCEIDYLECVGNRFGADVATGVLANIRAEVGKHLLQSDWIVALDDDSFLIMLPHAALEVASRVADKVRTLVATGLCGRVTGIPLTASIGVAVVDPPHDCGRYAPIGLVEMARACLAQSRLQGGNCVTSARVQAPML